MSDAEELVITVGKPEDLDQLMDIALKACDENGFLPPDPQKLAMEIYPALMQDHGIVGVIGTKDNPIQGAVLLRIGTMWYSHQPVVEEKAIFIHPDFRSAKGGRANKLCEFSKSVADSLGLPLIIGVLSNRRTEAKIRMYERQFGKPAGAFFLYGAKTGEYARTEQ